MKENLDIFFTGLDAQEVIFKTSSGPRKVQALFDNGFYDTSIGETILDTTKPRLTCKNEDVDDMKDFDENKILVNVSGKKFRVTQVQPEGTGLATIVLAHE